MGSDQSSLAHQGKPFERRERCYKENNGKKKQRGTGVKGVKEYEHLPYLSDNSARSSPEDARSSVYSFRDAAGKRNSSSRNSLCFLCCGRNDETAGPSDPNPRQSSDSVSLLRVASKSSLQPTDTEVERNSYPGKYGQHTDEALVTEMQNEVYVVPDKEPKRCDLNFSEFANGRDSSSPNPALEETSSRGLGSCKNVDSSNLNNINNSKKEKQSSLSKKYFSFPIGLSTYQKSKPAAEACIKHQLEVEKESQKRGVGKAEELDCTSNSMSCEDSGKASESEIFPCTSDLENNLQKAPIAKMDSLETTSVDSLNSDDLMLGTAYSPCLSSEDIGTRVSWDLLASSENGMNADAKTKNKFHFSQSVDSSANVQRQDDINPSRSSLSELKLNKRQRVITINERAHLKDRNHPSSTPFPDHNQWAPRDTTDESGELIMTNRRKHSYPPAGSSFSLLPQLTSNGVPDSIASQKPHSSESSDQQIPFDNDCVFIDKATYDEAKQECEMVYSMLSQLQTVISQESDISWNQTGIDFREQLCSENEALKAELRSLQQLVREKDDCIAALRDNVAQENNTTPTHCQGTEINFTKRKSSN